MYARPLSVSGRQVDVGSRSIPSEYIRQLADHEHQMVSLTLAKGDIFGVFANTAFATMETAVAGVFSDHPLFAGTWTHIRCMSALALLSALRQHRVQMTLNLRQVFEGTCLLAYVMAHPDADRHRPSSLLQKQVYPWVEREFGDLSKAMRDLKAQINQMSGHANIEITANVFDYQSLPREGQAKAFFFDHPDDNWQMANLYEVGEAIYTACIVLHEANHRFPACTLGDEFEVNMEECLKVGSIATQRFNEKWDAATAAQAGDSRL